jgi:hypothetical protein
MERKELEKYIDEVTDQINGTIWASAANEGEEKVVMKLVKELITTLRSDIKISDTWEIFVEEDSMTKEEKVKFCIESAEEFGEDQKDWEGMSDFDLAKAVEWFDYLWEK